jgi:hypothetical protein
MQKRKIQFAYICSILSSSTTHRTAFLVELKRKLSSVILKNHLHLTLNFREESYDKGLSEDADVKASEGVLCPFEAF